MIATSLSHRVETQTDVGKILLSILADLTADLSIKERCDRLLHKARTLVPFDAAAIMRFDAGELIPVAAFGLSPSTLGKRFNPGEHPRLQAILDKSGPLVFDDNDPRPDPFDGMLDNDKLGAKSIHSCMGATLYVKDYIAGVMTLDASDPGLFLKTDQWLLATIVQLAAAALRIGRLIETLQKQAEHRGMVTRDLVTEALQRGGELLGDSPAMRKLIEEVEIVAHTDMTVLIGGETGTGKEVVARTIHAKSTRADHPLVYVNCAALPEQIAESELFGHIKGAFTGAERDRSGKFELAHRGTLLLDEVGELPLLLQSKLLRAIQFGEIQRVGEDRNISVDVRIIAASNRNLADEVAEGNFRADLYHRLRVYPVTVPALRHRADDVIILAGHFMDMARIRLGCKEVRLSSAALMALGNYDWPGNVRELEHVIMRAALRASSESSDKVVMIEPRHLDIDNKLGMQMSSSIDPGDIPGTCLSSAVDEFQRKLILHTVERCGQNWSEAARQLKLDRANLHRLARRLGLK